jgi:glycosyltransferase involved in cell wall biosynthesis
MNHLTIAHVLSSFSMGGQERIALDLARQQVAAGHRVLVYSLIDDPNGAMVAAFQAAGARTDNTPKLGPSFDPTLAVRLSRRLTREKVDIVHTHNPRALVYGAPAAALSGISCIHTKHGINPDPSRRMWLRRAASTMVNAYVAVTPTLARLAISRGECEPTQLRVVPNGIDTARFRPDLEARRRIRAELGIPEGAWVAGTVGRLATEKNQSLLIDAISPMLDPRRHLVIVGDGPARDALHAQAQGTMRPNLVHFTGARDDVEALLSAMDVFVLTSQSEGLPLVLLEAMAAGLPVLSTSVGGVPDLVEHEKTGYLAPAGDRVALTSRLIWLSGRPQAALDTATAARAQVLERHTLQHMANSYEALYARTKRRQPHREPLPLNVSP